MALFITSIMVPFMCGDYICSSVICNFKESIVAVNYGARAGVRVTFTSRIESVNSPGVPIVRRTRKILP